MTEKMTSDQVWDAFQEVKAKTKKAEKEALLKTYLKDANFSDSVWMALDPTMRFGIAKKMLDKAEKRFQVVIGRHDLDSEIKWSDGRYESTYGMLEEAAQTLGNGGASIVLRNDLPELHQLLTEKSWNLFRAIVEKRPDIGATASTINKIKPGMVTTFDCMLAKPFEAHRVEKWPVVAEYKLDGMRVIATVDFVEDTDGVGETQRAWMVSFFTRTGKEVTTLEPLRVALSNHLTDSSLEAAFGLTESFVLDFELMAGDFASTMSEARRKDHDAQDVVAWVFDAMSLREFKDGKSHRPYNERRKTLEGLIGFDNPHWRPVPRYLMRSEEEIHDLARKVWEKGIEGLIIKPLDHHYECKRSFSWMKVKRKETFDLPIKGFEEGTGKYANQLGALVVDFNGVDVRVGGGLSDHLRAAIWKDQESYLDRLIEVDAHEITPDGSLRHPRFIRFRDDKEEAA